MAEKTKTDILKLPRILPDKPFVRQQFNEVVEDIDQKVLPVQHAATKAHFDMWQPNTNYDKQDVVRTPTCPNWGFYMCIEPGVSGTDAPAGYGEGDEIGDGTCKWRLKLFGGATFLMHDDLKGRNKPDQHTIAAITGLQDLLDKQATKAEVTKAMEELIAGAPEELDTLKEIADALIEDGKAISNINQILKTKVDKETGKGLSTNDYTDADKNKVDFITVTEKTNLDDIRIKTDRLTVTKNINLDSLAKNSHVHKNQSVLDKFGQDKNTATFNGKPLTGGAPDWTPLEEYTEHMLVVYEGKLYRCQKSHTAEEKFKQIYWQSMTSESVDRRQITKMGVTAPKEEELPVSYTTRFNLPPVEVLKFNPEGGEQDQIYTLCTFDNSDGGDFIVDGQNAQLDEELIFDGNMHIKTQFRIPCSEVIPMGLDSMCETAFIEFSKYKKVEAIRGGFF